MPQPTDRSKFAGPKAFPRRSDVVWAKTPNMALAQELGSKAPHSRHAVWAKTPNMALAKELGSRVTRSAFKHTAAVPGERAAATVAESAELFYGMNIHPQYSSTPWFKTPKEVMAEVAALGCTVVRCDCYGSWADADKILAHVMEAEPLGIQILPCFGYNQPAVPGDYQLNYSLGVDYGTTTANVLKDHCPIYEVSNEICIYCNGVGPGTDPAAYDHFRYADCRALIRGVIDGIKSVQPDAKIVIGGGVTTLTAFFRMMWDGTAPDGSTGHELVRWDYTGWHWYESSGSITQAYDGTGTPYNVLEELSRFGVPIWITELGFIPQGTPEAQSAYVEAALDEYRGYRDSYNVVNTCWYTLYDDASGTFGLLEDDGQTRKPAYATYQGYVAQHPDQGGGGGSGGGFYTGEYTLPLELHEKLVNAADENNVTENDELVRRLELTFTP
jgi:hypothetical protein